MAACTVGYKVLFTTVKSVALLDTSSLLAANPEYCVLVALSPVLVPLVLLNTVKSASVTYLLFKLSAISAVVASAQAVTKPLASYVILVFVAPVIGEFAAVKLAAL